MEEKQTGVTALVTAYARAYHASVETHKIFDDFLAGQLFSAEEHAFFTGSVASLLPLFNPELAAANPTQAEALAWVMQNVTGPITLSRSRYCEDCLDLALAAGVNQYVILGAGLDTFAFRRPELAGQVQIFEVDHPATQNLKKDRIAAAGWAVPGHLHFIPIDFTQHNLGEVLQSSAYNPHTPAFYSWLGVTFYLERAAVLNTLQTIAGCAAPGSRVVFDFKADDGSTPAEQNSRHTRQMEAITRQSGEPMKSAFDPHTLGATLLPLGLRLQEMLSPDQIEERYFSNRSDQYHASDHTYLAQVEVI